MCLAGVMRFLGHQDIRMTLRYRLPPGVTAAPPVPERAHDPDQLLGHLAQWVRKHATPRPPRDLLRCIERLRQDVQTVMSPTKK
jgi:hypothetical protein